MKRILLSLFVAALSLGLAAAPVEAKRLGGGGSSGMKRQAPPTQPAQTPAQTPGPSVPAKPAATPGANAAAPAAAAAQKRSWMGPIAGLAAGLGIAALLSHFGLGEGVASILTMVLLAMVAIFVIRFLLLRFGPNAGAARNGLATAGAGNASFGQTAFNKAPVGQTPFDKSPAFGSGSGPIGQQPAAFQPEPVAHGLPAGFDAPAFERIAKLIFIRMQAANDAGNLDDLRQFATPEMFATFRLDLQDRSGGTQQTDVVQLNAQVIDFVQEAEQQIVSVRFHGLIREEKDGPTTTFDEVWHLVKPTDGSREWAIAGIAQNDAP